MKENAFSPDDQREFDRIADIEIDKLEAEHKSEIDELGYPEWLITAFQRLRRLADSLSRDRFHKTNPEIANEIQEILKVYPDSLFAYDEKCIAKAHRAMQELVDAVRKKESDEANPS